MEDHIKTKTEIMFLKMYSDIINVRGVEIPTDPVKIFTLKDIDETRSKEEKLFKLFFTENGHEYDKEEVYSEGMNLFFLWVYSKVFGHDERTTGNTIIAFYLKDSVMRYMMRGFNYVDENISYKFDENFYHNLLVVPLVDGIEQNEMNIFKFLDKYRHISEELFLEFYNIIESLAKYHTAKDILELY